jgi:hypothetical protein
MTAEQFRKLVLSVPDTEEHAHHHHPDFRLRGKIFATLGFPDQTRAMVKLTPEQQAEFMHDHPDLFSPCAGAWGRQGSTSVCLPKATVAVMQLALKAAAQNAVTAAETSKSRKTRKRQ